MHKGVAAVGGMCAVGGNTVEFSAHACMGWIRSEQTISRRLGGRGPVQIVVNSRTGYSRWSAMYKCMHHSNKPTAIIPPPPLYKLRPCTQLLRFLRLL